MVVDSNMPFAFRGKKVTLKLFISGYGEVSSPKLFIQMPPELHDPEHSQVRLNLHDNNHVMQFGGDSLRLEGSMTIIFAGLILPHWREPSLIFDTQVTNGSYANIITTEMTLNRAPFEIEIRVKGFEKNSFRELKKYFRQRPPAGRHAVQFVFTYFNGDCWVSQKVPYDLIVPTWYQAHELLTWLVAAVLALLGIVATVIH